MSEELRAALEDSAQGWSNAVELGLLPSQHHDNARRLADQCNKALAALRASTDAAPVAWMYTHWGHAKDRAPSELRFHKAEQVGDGWTETPLYAHSPVAAAAVAGEGLGRFGHHPEASIDYECEVDALIAMAYDRLTGMREHADLEDRIRKALEFRALETPLELRWLNQHFNGAREVYAKMPDCIAQIADKVGLSYPTTTRAEPNQAIAIGKTLDAEDGGYPAPGEPVGLREDQRRRRETLIERIGTFADGLSAKPLPGVQGDVAYDLLRQAAAQISSDNLALSTLTRTDEASTDGERQS